MNEEALPFDLQTEDNTPTEPKIPLIPHVEKGDFQQAIMNIASIAGSCFAEMYIDALRDGNYELARLVLQAEIACRHVVNHITR